MIEIRKKKKPFFDNKTQMDLNSLWISVLIQADKITNDEKLHKKAETYYKNLEKNMLGNIIIVTPKNMFFLRITLFYTGTY